MTNKELASKFNMLGKLMGLHGENPFKIKSYTNAYLTLRKLPDDLTNLTEEEIAEIPGVGKAISAKIRELIDTGEMQTMNKYLDITPEGIQEMLTIRGFGAKKIMTIWKDLGIETVGELLHACKENRLVKLKGFGLKTQAQLQTQLEYFVESRGSAHYAAVLPDAEELLEKLRDEFPDHLIAIVGEVARKLPVINGIEILSDVEFDPELIGGILATDDGLTYNNHNVDFHFVETASFGLECLLLSSSDEFSDAILEYGPEAAEEEEMVFDQLDLAFIPAELREDDYWIGLAKEYALPELIEVGDIKGVVHNHSTYSDGLNTVEEMALECMKQGYEYLVMSDHSKSAFYANGLQPDRVYHQQEEIDLLNQKYPDFKIFKSIESDILSDGSLDYEEDILRSFDLVIASVHSNLKMDEEKATRRLITAIENPYTRILGHPTGRLLLARKGYPIDHKRVIDACAANDVVIELNASPHRLDMDWSWIPYATEKGVMISINPDAHSISGINDIQWGVAAARKGGLTIENCLNSKSLLDFKRWIKSKA
ncbi:DNA polymerase/3'-5' exonuclease PolX [Portibacter lacus]|uniref:DNA polymerase/3'-5' exonuclease PolX n=1 Tax=Portibacter lacus TaxID=1099794 RepID=A0AA37SRD3_9BACT|nr:DNA polymerase/3'-5' exonuclease PolX [Portibacter lacus]GLR17361.1 DNA polymerase/3'-5' exonuclease PolX [Portibacter lacus]